jgi:hypothetical protein
MCPVRAKVAGRVVIGCRWVSEVMIEVASSRERVG